MSNSKMDLVDHEYMVSMFPRYLLKQPIAHELWKLYYQHKKLFHKLKTKDELLNVEVDPSNSVSFQNLKTSNKLNTTTRKEIWEKLSQLGVLGTIPYDALSDEYLIQVHKYFYAREYPFGSNDKQGDIDMTKPAMTEEEYLESLLPQSEDDDEEGDDDDDDDDDNEEDEEDDDIANDEDAEEQEDSDNTDEEEPSNFIDNNRRIREATDQLEHSNRIRRSIGNERFGEPEIENVENVAYLHHNKAKHKSIYYPEVSESKHTIQLKQNPIPGDIYKTLGYPLPHRWQLQPDNSILLPQDGCAMLRVNPNWHALSSYGRASPIMNSRLRVNINSKKKQQWATTWANSGVNHTKCAIFYFEIRVLSVTSSQAGRNSHVLVGFKNWAKVNDQTSNSEITPPENSAGSTSGHTNMLRNVLDGNRNTSSSPNSSSQQSQNEVETFSYSGLDGNKFDASGSQKYSRPFGNDDIVGCGVNFIEGTIFFTKNGIFLGNAFEGCFDIDLVPFVSIKSGNSLRTNFGLTEEFLFDIDQYQLKWKYKTYSHIFKAVDYDPGLNLEDEESDSEDFEKLSEDVDQDVDMDGQARGLNYSSSGGGDNVEEDQPDGFLLTRDRRFSGDKLWKPNTAKLNNINSNNDSIPCQLNSMINDYLIHEGYIDVAKGFLKDLQRDCIPNNSDERARIVIRHNERQILKEEQNLQVRQTIRRFIQDGEILKCMKFIDEKFPGLLDKHLELTFEMKCADYLLCLAHQSPENDMIDSILLKGQEISSQFLQSPNIPNEMKHIFRERFDEISPLMAYDNPSKECTDDRSFYLTPAYLQERLFQTINTHILQYLDKKSQSSLESMIGYTRAMVATLMENDCFNPRDKEPAYHKLINIDEDLLKL